MAEKQKKQSLAKLQITSDGIHTYLFINGKEMSGVTYCKFEHSLDDLATLTLKFNLAVSNMEEK